jgi:hypothetical protein
MPVATSAQEGARAERVVRGLVVDSVSGRPLDGVVMYLDGRRDEFFTGADGHIRISGLRRRDSTLVLRLIGYVPRRVPIPDSEAPLAIDLGTVTLRPIATQLDRIAVEAEEVIRYPQLEAFYRRKQSATGGTFITREDIERVAGRRTSDILRRVAKIELDCYSDKIGSDECLSRNRRGRVPRPVSTVAPGTRRGGVVIIEEPPNDDVGVDRCDMEIFLDGQRTALKVDEIPVNWIGAIEVYSGLATTPPGLGAGQCGVIAIWTTSSVGG